MTITTATEEKTETRPCLCGLVSIEIPAQGQYNVKLIPAKHRRFLETAEADDAGWVYLSTNCGQETSKTFAPGHDARLKGLLQTALMLNGEARYSDGFAAVSSAPMTFAENHLSESLAAQVRAAEGREPKVAKPRKPAKAKGVVKTEAKVGRWTYTGRIDPLTGEFCYTAKDGREMRAAKGKFAI